MGNRVELSSVQGLLRFGYGRCPAARFVPLQITDQAGARAWLRALLTGGAQYGIRDACSSPATGQVCVNLAFSYEGLRAIGLDPQALAQFSREFQEGMGNNAHRSRVLGDSGASDPTRWRWGGPRNDTLHMMLMLYAEQTTIASVHAQMTELLARHGLVELERLPETRTLPGQKEHFGFADGLAQPQVEDLDLPAQPEHWEGNRIRLGEVLLGYANEYGQFTERPLLGPESDPQNLLPDDLAGSGRRDFGRDGSYVVIRQLSQDVAGWWRFMDEATGGEGMQRPEPMIELATKMIGRTPEGKTIALSAKALEADARGGGEDAFDYDDDPEGLGCPLGAHVRRANPRGAFAHERGGPSSKAKALTVSRRHRVVRRGRAYGPPLEQSLAPERLRAAENDGLERGLYFICLNANIARQFEFLQQAWLLNPKFQGGYDDVDPVLGGSCPLASGVHASSSFFTLPALPVRRRYADLPRFVSMLGGAYLFVPSIPALQYLAWQS